MSEIAERLTLTDWGTPEYLDGAEMQFMVTDESTPLGRCIAYFSRREDAEKLIEADRLAAENAALREALEGLRSEREEWARIAREAAAETTTLAAERDRLREALEAIERISHSVPDYAIFYEISRAALKWRTTG